MTKVFRSAALAVVPLLTILTACGGHETARGTEQVTMVDYPGYETAAALTAASDVVVRGTVGSLRGTETDDGGDGSGEGLPMLYFNFTVDEVLAGPDPGSSLALAWLNTSDPELSVLTPGDHLIIFAEYVTDTEAPGMTLETAVYVPLSGDNGVLDVTQNAVVARSPFLTSLEGLPQGRQAGASDTEPLQTTLDALRAAVTKYS